MRYEGESLAKRSGVKHWRDGGHSSLQRDLSALRGAVYRTLSAIHSVVYINEIWRRKKNPLRNSLPSSTEGLEEIRLLIGIFPQHSLLFIGLFLRLVVLFMWMRFKGESLAKRIGFEHIECFL